MCDELYEADIGTVLSTKVSALMSEDFEDVCRLCMSNEKPHSRLDMVAISEMYPNSNTPISSLFSDVLQINVDDGDAVSSSMPQKACMECLRKLRSYADFKEQSHSVDAKLRKIVHQRQKILEAQALYGPAFSDLETLDCGATLQFAEDVEKLPRENSFLNVHQVEGLWDDVNSMSEDSDSNCEKSKLVYNEKSIPDFCQEFSVSCSEKISSADTVSLNLESSLVSEETPSSISTSQSTDDLKGNNRISSAVSSFSTDSAPVSLLVDNPVVTCPNNQSQTINDNVTLCPDIIGEVEVPESSATEESAAVEFIVPDILDNEALSPEASSNTYKIVSSDQIKKCSSSLPTPEVFAIVGHQTEKKLGFRCPLCKKVFQSNIQYRKHASLHVKAKGGVCKYCEKWFQTSNALFRHERIHSGEKPFLCILCDRSFSQREILQRHILTHSDTKPFQCQNCDKSYAQKSGLESHVKHHHKPVLEISQYPCILCNKAFCHPSGLSRHMLTHSGKQYVCKFCERNFSDSSALRRHSKNKHGSLP